MRSWLRISGIIGILPILWIPVSCPAITLDEALNFAQNQNPLIHQQTEQIKAKKAAFAAEISPENPHVFVEYDGIPKTGKLSAYGHRKVGFAQTLEFPLAYFLRGKQARLHEQLEWSQLRILQNTIETDVKITFNQALMLAKQQTLTEELVDLSRQILDKAIIRVTMGEAPPYESLKAQVDLATAKNALLALRQRQENTRLNLVRLLGLPAHAPLNPEGELVFDPISPDPDSLLEIAERQHPELLLTELEVTGKKLYQKQTRADLIPNFEIRMFQTEAASGVNAVSYGGELALSIPLWAPLKNRGAIREARYLKNAAEWHREEIRQNIHLQLHKALNRLETATRQMTSYQENTLQQSRELQRIVTRSYEEGAMSYLEVTEALRSIVTIKSGYLEAIFNCLAAEAELTQAIGGKSIKKSE